MKQTRRLLGFTAPLAVLLLGGCMAPLSQPTAPVVDRSVYRQGQPSRPAEPPPRPTQPAVEAMPLERPEPIVAERPRMPDPAPIDTAPAPGQAAESPPSGQQSSQAVATLLDSAASHVGRGQMDQAAGDLERALGIDPSDAAIWHDLGQIRMHQGELNQALSMFEKSNSLAGDNRFVRAKNWRAIAYIRGQMGDSAGAEAATAQAIVLER